MAARVNTKLIFIIIIVFGTAAGMAGGVWFLKQRNDASRHVAKGQEFEQQGDDRKAAQYYERAVAKEPGNFDYLKMMEGAILAIRPVTEDEATEWYRKYVSVLQHAAIHAPDNAAYHLRLLKELHSAARQSGSWGYTSTVAEAADEMWKRLPASDPQRIEAKLYRGMAKFSPWMFDRLTQDEIDGGEAELREYLEAVPDSDMGWATLADGLLGQAERLRNAGQPTRADQKLQQTREAVADGLERVPDGPEVLIESIKLALYDRRNTGEDGDTARLRAQVDELVRIARERMDSWLHTQVASLLARLYWLDGVPDPQTLVGEYLAANPEAHDQRLHEARLHYFNQEFDEAEASARVILDSELLPVSYLSQFQFELKKQAASLVLDVKVRRWELTPEDERDGPLEEAKKAEEVLAGMSRDPDNDPLVLRARGKVAFIEKKYGEAAALFNRLVSGGTTDYETLMFAALSLEQRGEIGAAADALKRALEYEPDNVENLMRLARLRYQMRHYELASEIVTHVLDLAPDDQRALQLKDQIARALAPESATLTHPVQVVLDAARNAMQEGGLEAAYKQLLDAHDEAPDDLSLINALIRIEIELGKKDDALAHVNHGLELAPGNRTLLTLKANIEKDDPIEAIKQYLVEVYPDDEVDSTVEMLLSLREMARMQDAAADRLERRGDADGAAKARALAERARSEQEALRARAEELAPEHPRLIEYKFVTALTAEDWRTAERLARQAADLNLDQADGAMFEGRIHLAKGEAEAAVRAFRRATEQISYSGLAWRLLGAAYERVGNMDEALAALERSYSNNPADLTSTLAYGDMLMRTGNQARALNIFRAALRLAPQNVEVRETWLNLEAEVGSPAVALQRRLEIYADNPTDKVNAAALVAVLGTTVPVREMLLDSAGLQQYTEDRWRRLPDSSRQRIVAEKQAQWREEADHILEELQPPGERNLEWHALKAELLRARGDVDGGAEVLRGYTQSAGAKEDRLALELSLGLYLRRVGRMEEAIATFEQARQFQDPETRRADLALGELLFDLQRYEEAMPLYESVREVNDSRRVALRAAECLVMLDRYTDATERLDAIESDGGRDGTSALLRAAVLGGEAEQAWDRREDDLGRRLENEYKETLDLAEHLDPTNPMPHVLRARSLFKRFQRTGETVLLDDALVALTRADEVSPGFYRTSLTRVIILEAMGNGSGALAELTRLVEQQPDLDQARQLLVQKLIDDGRIDAAVTLAQEALRIDPTSVRWLERLGDLHTTYRDDPVAAGEQYEAAVNLSPMTRLIAKRASAYLDEDPPRTREAIAFLAKFRAEFEASSILRGVYARALAVSGQRDDALEEMRIAYAQQRRLIQEGEAPASSIRAWYGGLRNVFADDQPADVESFATDVSGGNLDAYEMHSLANFWRLVGAPGRTRAAELLRSARDARPEDDPEFLVRINKDLGVVLLQMGDVDGALEAFEGILAVHPDDAEVLNNIAYLISESLKDPRRALEYADRALEIQPNSWAILDTVGWIEFQLERYPEAEGHLRQSIEQEKTPTNLIHLAKLLKARGDYTRALRYLSEAAELRPDAETLKEINKESDDIRTRQQRGQ